MYILDVLLIKMLSYSIIQISYIDFIFFRSKHTALKADIKYIKVISEEN